MIARTSEVMHSSCLEPPRTVKHTLTQYKSPDTKPTKRYSMKRNFHRKNPSESLDAHFRKQKEKPRGAEGERRQDLYIVPFPSLVDPPRRSHAQPVRCSAPVSSATSSRLGADGGHDGIDKRTGKGAIRKRQSGRKREIFSGGTIVGRSGEARAGRIWKLLA
jgi:hypothetical protein